MQVCGCFCSIPELEELHLMGNSLTDVDIREDHWEYMANLKASTKVAQRHDVTM